MPYTKTVWIDNAAPPINAANLNKIESQLEVITGPTIFAGNVGSTIVGDNSHDDYAGFQSLIDAAPDEGTTRGVTIVLDDKPYKLNTGLVMDKKNVRIVSPEGHCGPGGPWGGRFVFGANNQTLLKLGANTSGVFHGGPSLRGVGFENNNSVALKTGSRAIWMDDCNRSILHRCWFSRCDVGIRLDGPDDYSGSDNAWHMWNMLQFYRIGDGGPSTGGCAALDLGVSNGIMFDMGEYIIISPSASGLNYGILSNTPGTGIPPVGSGSNQISKQFMDGDVTGGGGRTRMIHLAASRHTHITNVKIEQCLDGVYMGGNYNGGSLGRGNVVENVGISGCVNGLILDGASGTACGDISSGTTHDGGKADNISFDPGVTNKLVNQGGATPPGFTLGLLMNK